MNADAPSSTTDRRAKVIGVLCMTLTNIVWFTPIVFFLVHICLAQLAHGVLLALAAFGFGTATGKLPLGWFALTHWEAQGNPYRRLGVRRFRTLVFEGEWMNRLARGARGVSLQKSRQSLEFWRQRSLINQQFPVPEPGRVLFGLASISTEGIRPLCVRADC